MQHTTISRVRCVQENQKIRFKEAFDGWTQGRSPQAAAAALLGGDRGRWHLGAHQHVPLRAVGHHCVRDCQQRKKAVNCGFQVHPRQPLCPVPGPTIYKGRKTEGGGRCLSPHLAAKRQPGISIGADRLRFTPGLGLFSGLARVHGIRPHTFSLPAKGWFIRLERHWGIIGARSLALGRQHPVQADRVQPGPQHLPRADDLHAFCCQGCSWGLAFSRTSRAWPAAVVAGCPPLGRNASRASGNSHPGRL